MLTKKILIVEDDRIQALVLSSTLESLGYMIAGQATTAEHAIALAGEKEPDLILMDIHLAGEKDGIYAAEQILADRNIPIIYLTAYADQETVSRAKTTGPFGYILKPVNERELKINIDIAFYKAETEKELLLYRNHLEELVALRTAELEREISVRIQAEQVLVKSEEKYHAIFNNVQEVFFQADLQGRILEISPSIKRYMGYAREEMIGMQAEMFYDNPEDYSLFMQALQNKGEIYDYEILCRTREGHILYGSTNTHFILDSTSRKIGIEGTIRDITQRKQAEEKLTQEIDLRKKKEQELLQSDSALRGKTLELEEVNKTLKVLLRQTASAKKETEEKILLNVKDLLGTYIDKLSNTPLESQQKAYINIIQANLNNLTSPFSKNLLSQFSGLTPAEMQVANYIRDGYKTKKISALLNLSKRTIEFHRKNIRSKLGIAHKKKNLQSLILTFNK